MVQSNSKSWIPLGICAVLQALFSAMILLVVSPGGPEALRSTLQASDSVTEMGLLALAAGVCAFAAAVWNMSKAGSWLLMLNGIACAALGLLMNTGTARPVTFRSVSGLVGVMAMSLGFSQIARASALERSAAEKWLLGALGLVSFGFALAFLGFVLRWIKLDASPSAQTFNWLGSYFAFSAMCMMGMALRMFRARPDGTRSGRPRAGVPRIPGNVSPIA